MLEDGGGGEAGEGAAAEGEEHVPQRGGAVEGQAVGEERDEPAGEVERPGDVAPGEVRGGGGVVVHEEGLDEADAPLERVEAVAAHEEPAAVQL